ncbi:MAG: hypothetical protein U1U88_001969 [Lawsonella clevelandensis]
MSRTLTSTGTTSSSLAAATAANEGEIAGLIAMPYLHRAFGDTSSRPRLLGAGSKTCTDNGIVLIVDDVRAGWRLDLQGSDHFFGFEADHLLLQGTRQRLERVGSLRKDPQGCLLRRYVHRLLLAHRSPVRCRHRHINKLRNHEDACGHMRRIGEGIMSGLEKVAANHGFHMVTTGEPSLFSHASCYDNNFKLHQEFVAETVKRGARRPPTTTTSPTWPKTQEDVDKYHRDS